MPETIEVERCTIQDLGMEITGEDAPPLVEAINAYLRIFAKPTRKENGNNFAGSARCLKCESTLDGMLGTFRWGIVHGEGFCSECEWPARALHRPKDKDGEVFNRPLEFILQYHPDAE